jgi:hypothetical protein
MVKGKNEMVTARKFAELKGVSHSTVLRWLSEGLIEGVVEKPDPYKDKGTFFLIPKNASVPRLKVGRPKKSKKR